MGKRTLKKVYGFVNLHKTYALVLMANRFTFVLHNFRKACVGAYSPLPASSEFLSTMNCYYEMTNSMHFKVVIVSLTNEKLHFLYV